MSKGFLDTSILADAADGGVADKQQIARDLMGRLAAHSEGVISTQVLQEFYVAATRKLPGAGFSDRVVPMLIGLMGGYGVQAYVAFSAEVSLGRDRGRRRLGGSRNAGGSWSDRWG